MATTKELLEKAIRKIASNACGRESTFITLTLDPNVLDWQTYTAPSDGFLRLYFDLTIDSGYMKLKDTSGDSLERLTVGKGCMLGDFIRLSKGQLAYFRYYQVPKKMVAQFFKSVGGGLKALAETLGRGGAIWLRLRVCLTQLSRQGASSLIRRAIQSLSRLSRLTQTTLQRGRMDTLTLARAMEYCLLTTPQERTHTSAEQQRVVESKRLGLSPKTHATHGCLSVKETLSTFMLSTKRLRQLSVSILQVGKYDCLAIEGGI